MTSSSLSRFARWPIWIVFVAIFVYFLPVFLLKQSFLSGDHWEQQYPWAAFMQQMLRAGQLPWWTTRIGCGFPILAEGQIGAFYPLNWLFYFFLPLKVAYSGIILFHYFLGSLLFYVFVRRLNFSRSACLFSTLIYVFGSTQCGYFYYNFISQKTVIWLPLALLLLDRLRTGGGFFDACALATTLALALFGGYIQVAVYVWLFIFFYFCYFFIQNPSKKFLGWSLFAALLAVAVSLMQLIPTAELASLTSRSDMGKEFSYVGSMNPLGFLTLIYPSWDGWLRSELYLSILGLFFIFYGFFKVKDTHQNFFIWALVIFLLLALGRFSPLYRVIIELTHFSGFRTPIKFLFFVGFSLAILAGYGWDRFFNQPHAQDFNVWKIFCVGLIPAAMIPFMGPSLLKLVQEKGVGLLQSYVKRFIFNQPGHPHDLNAYLKKAAEYYASVIQMIDWHLPQNFLQSLVILFSLLLLGWVAHTKLRGHFFKLFFLVFLTVDLFFYGTTSIRANLENYSHVTSPGESIPGLTATLEPAVYRVADYYREGEETRRYPLFPSQNMVYSRDHLGIYSPLVLSGWVSVVQGITYLNDSIQAQYVEPDIFLKRIAEISVLNIQYVFSLTALHFPGWRELQSTPFFLYRNTAVQPRYFFYAGDLPPSLAQIDTQKIKSVSALTLGQLELKAAGQADQAGWLIGSETYYPGWKAELNGKKAKLEKFAGVFRAIRIAETGRYEVTMVYLPFMRRWSGIGLTVWGILLSLSFFYLISGQGTLQIRKV